MANDNEKKEKTRINARTKELGYEVIYCNQINDFFTVSIKSEKNVMTGILPVIMRQLGYDLNSVSIRDNGLYALFISEEMVAKKKCLDCLDKKECLCAKPNYYLKKEVE